MIGQVFLGRYEVVSALGQGGMGRIFLAKHRTTQRTVVLKVMHPQVARQPEFRDLFQREMQCMTRFTHPYAVALYDASLRDPQGPCIVMEYVKGTDFERLLQRHRRFALQRVGRLIGQLCEVLHAAHEQGIIHRDLKPANLMVTDWDQPLERLKVMDFGLAHVAQGDERPKSGGGLIGEMVLTGTPEYMSPEQAACRKLDGRADLYSVGVILYEILTGARPFERSSPTAYAVAHINDAPPPMPPSLVTPAVAEVVMACLAKSPENRPSSALDLAKQLGQALGKPILDAGGPATANASAVATMSGTSLRRTMVQARATQVGAAPTPRPSPAPAKPAAAPIDTTPDYPEYQLEAAMLLPETLDKLNRFAQRLGGKVIGLHTDQLRVLLSKDCRLPAVSDSSNGFLPVLTEMELQVERKDPKQPSPHVVTLRLSPVGGGNSSVSPMWRACCERIHAELRSSLTPAAAPAARR